MINTMKEYRETRNSLSLEEMEKIHEELIQQVINDDDGIELYDELIETATRYAQFRAEWLQYSKARKMDIDSSRTSCHNSLIIKFNMLARYLKMQNKSTNWRDLLGYEEDDRYNRKRMGDFGCYLVFVNSLCAR